MAGIKNFVPRLYQETIMASCAKGNCLVILPTGLGKTKTAILAAVQRLNAHPDSKILFLTVTKPLAEQIYGEFKECVDIEEEKIAIFTGSVSPEKREEIWKKSTIVVSTPQCIENDEINIDWVEVDLPVVFTEIKKYLQTFISERLKKLKDLGILQKQNLTYVSKTELLGLQSELRGRASTGEKDFSIWNSISILAEIMKVSHALELLETQGIITLHKYMERLNNDAPNSKVKAVKSVVADLNFRSAFIKVSRLFE